MIVDIQDIAFGGRGVAHLDDGRVVFVPFTAPGDQVEISITHDHERYAEAEIIRLVTPGPGRVPPVCPYYKRCGGCQYQHLSYELQLDLKTKQLGDVLQRIGHLGDLPDVAPIVASPKPFGYRNKLTLEPVLPSRETSDNLEYGFCELDNQTFFTVDSCPLASDALNALLPKIGRTKAGRRNAAAEKPRKLTMRQTSDGSTHFYFGRATSRATWLEEDLLGRSVRVPLGSFWQVNPEVAATMFQTLETWGQAIAGTCLVDAYGGAGAFSLVMGNAFKEHVVIEADSEAINAASYNHANFGLTKTRCLRGRTEQRLPSVLQNMKPAKLASATVLLDPPRTGCHKKVINALLSHRPGHVVYVSCNPATLARDLRTLCQEAGYTMTHLALFDMFPQTSHFETAVLLTSTQ